MIRVIFGLGLAALVMAMAGPIILSALWAIFPVIALPASLILFPTGVFLGDPGMATVGFVLGVVGLISLACNWDEWKPTEKGKVKFRRFSRRLVSR